LAFVDFQTHSITRKKAMLNSETKTSRIDKMVDLQLAARELELRKELIVALAVESEKQELIRSTQIEEPELICRLLEAGFQSENLSALELVPIAFVAWASGSITNHERKVVMSSLDEFGLPINQASNDQFRSWLDTRPDRELFLLWKDYVTAKLRAVSSEVGHAIGIRLLKKSTEVAMASGGLLGFGTVCESEQAVLDEITDVFGLCDLI